MGYYEGEIGSLCGNNSGFGNGWEGLIGLALVAGLFDNGNGGLFGNRGGNNGGCCTAGLATQADLANGFAQNTLQRGIDDIILGQATMQNFINQGFSGVNATVERGFAGVNNAVCTLGYQNQAGFNALSREYADCCCKTQGAIADLKYSNERQTCDIISAINAGNQRLVDIYTNDKIDTLNRKLSLAENSLARRDDREILLRAINRDRCPEPAYIVPNPNCCYQYNVTQGCGCGCGNF